MSTRQSNEPKKIFPMKLQETFEQFIVVAAFNEKFYIKKTRPDSRLIVNTVKKALDLCAGIFCTITTAAPFQIITAELQATHTLAELPCPDRKEFTSDFWFKHNPAEFFEDIVRWVAKSPGCRMYRVYLCKSAAVYFLHENHPECKKILDVLWLSVTNDIMISYYTHNNFPTFICNAKIEKNK